MPGDITFVLSSSDRMTLVDALTKIGRDMVRKYKGFNAVK